MDKNDGNLMDKNDGNLMERKKKRTTAERSQNAGKRHDSEQVLSKICWENTGKTAQTK
jgi:hypothetical protein